MLQKIEVHYLFVYEVKVYSILLIQEPHFLLMNIKKLNSKTALV